MGNLFNSYLKRILYLQRLCTAKQSPCLNYRVFFIRSCKFDIRYITKTIFPTSKTQFIAALIRILLVNFLKMLDSGEDIYPNVCRAANTTLTGILAHESALQGGKQIKLPEWFLRD